MPSDINNPVDRAAEPHFGTLPKALTKKVGDISGELLPRVPVCDTRPGWRSHREV